LRSVVERVPTRIALIGVAVGALLALLCFAPAAWLARAVASATDQHLLLADARGSIWSGSAVPVLTGGPGSRDASALPGRLAWSLGLHLGTGGPALTVHARQACCIQGELQLRVRPGLGTLKLTLPPSTGVVGQWPAAWLIGLGTPFNTMQLAGTLRLSSANGLEFETARGRWLLGGSAALVMDEMSSPVTTLPTLGSYRLDLTGGAITKLVLSTLAGPLRLSGSGQFTAGGVRFRGEARADAGSENALNNLLNIIGRRHGAVAVLSIG